MRIFNAEFRAVYCPFCHTKNHAKNGYCGEWCRKDHQDALDREKARRVDSLLREGERTTPEGGILAGQIAFALKQLARGDTERAVLVLEQALRMRFEHWPPL